MCSRLLFSVYNIKSFLYRWVYSYCLCGCLCICVAECGYKRVCKDTYIYLDMLGTQPKYFILYTIYVCIFRGLLNTNKRVHSCIHFLYLDNVINKTEQKTKKWYSYSSWYLFYFFSFAGCSKYIKELFIYGAPFTQKR